MNCNQTSTTTNQNVTAVLAPNATEQKSSKATNAKSYDEKV
jgi:hypothetical protein